MKPKIPIPHTYVIVFGFIVFAALLTWILPAGQFNRTQKILADGRSQTVVEQNSYQTLEPAPQTWHIFTAIARGFANQANIIVFILLIGGAFWIMNASKAIDVGILSFIGWARQLEHFKLLQKIGVDNIIITLIMLMFSLFGAIFGMSEETIAFVIILIPLAINMGYDSIVGISMVYVAAHVGFAGAILNPFTIGIAQGLSDLPIFSGLEYRIICWLIINAVAITFILLYARKIKQNPQKSPMYEADEYWRQRDKVDIDSVSFVTPRGSWISFGLVTLTLLLFSWYYPESKLSIGNRSIMFPALPVATALFVVTSLLSLRRSMHFYILTLLGFTIVFLIIGVMGYEWYVVEIGALFFAMGIASGIAMGKTANEITKLFIEGAKDIFSAAFVVGIAGGIIVILTDGKIVDTIMYHVAQSMQELGKVATVQVMYLIQTGLNIIIPSGSAKAALTMPIMAPFSDLVGISRQLTVLAFQFGDGFTNMITPTSGILIGCIGIARIPYDVWFRWVWKFILLLIIVGAILLIPPLFIHFNGF
ncbi:MAG TPA: AbgT family transporter [Salinivirgaceae bacterium]|nr:AbgT family transporter [Salinivirgaceae bacterium]